MNEPLPGGRAILGVEWHGMTREIVESVNVEEDVFVFSFHKSNFLNSLMTHQMTS